MPLLDHFHPPVMDVLPWSSLHTGWLACMAVRLNQILPRDYLALEHAHVGPSIEIDVATFERGDRAPSEPYQAGGNGVAVAPPPAYAAPPPIATAPTVFADDFEVLVTGDRSGRHLVAAIELASPANKDRPETRRAFVCKCANYLHLGVCVVIVDVVTNRRANLHRETLSLLRVSDTLAEIPGGSDLYATAYRPVRRGDRTEVDVWAEPVVVGGLLPTLPLWLNAVEAVPLELEATYADTCRQRRIPM